jgi:hypothetical protein
LFAVSRRFAPRVVETVIDSVLERERRMGGECGGNMKSLVCRLALVLVALAGLAFAVTKWTVYSSTATYPNQGRYIMRSSSNHCLNLIFEGSASGSLVYTRSTNGGTNWSSLEQIANDYYDKYSSLGMYDSFPWVATVDPTEFEPPDEAMKGAVRTGGSWKSANVWDAGNYEAGIATTSTVASPSSTTQMAYSVIGWTQYTEGNATGWTFITFIAWDAQSGNGDPQLVWSTNVDSAYSDNSTSYAGEPSIAVSASGGNDTIHIAYRKTVSGTHQIFYVKSSNQVNPSRIRNGDYPTWSTPTRISSNSSESATQPSSDFDSSSSKLAVVWRGPNATGSNTGDVWHRTRTLGGNWNSEANVTGTSTKESDRPEALVGGDKTVYEELVSGSNYDVYFDWSGFKRNVSSTSTPSYDPHFASRGDTFFVVWTEDSTGSNYRVTFSRYIYVPDKGEGGEQGGRLVQIPDRARIVLQSVPNPLRGSTTFGYELQVPSGVALEVYSANGRLVRTLVGAFQNVGHHSAVWRGDDDQGERVPRGLYVCRLRAGSVDATTTVAIVE